MKNLIKSASCGNPAKFVWKGEVMSNNDIIVSETPAFQKMVKEQKDALLTLKDQLPKSREKLRKELKEAYKQGKYEFILKKPKIDGSWRFKILDKEGYVIMTVFLGEFNHPNPNINTEYLKGKYSLESNNFSDKNDTSYKIEFFEDPKELLNKINEYYQVYLKNK